MEDFTPISVALAWQNAVNAQDAETLVALSDPTIEIVGPRGSVHGHAILRDWLQRAGLSMESQRLFAKGDQVVIAQRGTWRNVTTNELMGEADIASHFRIVGQQVTAYARYDSLTDALHAANLTEADSQPLL